MKTHRIIGFALVAILICLSACSGGDDPIDPIQPTPQPEVVKSEITIDSSILTKGLSFTHEKGEQSISFSTNESWTLSVASTTSGATWCTASATSGDKGTASVKFSVVENTSYDNRSVSVTIKSGTATKTFTISQKGVDAMLVTTDKYEISQEGGTIDIEVKANISYQMEISEDAKSWITEASGRGLNTYKHSLNIAMNEEGEKREGEVYFKSDDKVETVKIYQDPCSILLLSQNECNVSDKGDTISVDIRSNIEFGVQMPDVDWIVDEASSRGLSSHTLKYVIKANEEYDIRSASIVFFDKNSELKDTLIVNQAQKDAIILSKKEISVASDGGTIEVKVASNVDFEVQIPTEATWITQTDSRALTEKSVYLKIAENMSEENRSAEIIFKNKSLDLSETVVITQKCPTPAGYNDGILTIKTAGTMKQLLGDDFLKITSLKIVGPINGDDVLCLRQMLRGHEFSYPEIGKLGSLDLTEASIVTGGKEYYLSNYTSNNVIGNSMFYKCKNLQDIVLPAGVTSIGDNAFSYCSSLTSVTIGAVVTSIGDNAFYDCSSLTSVHITDLSAWCMIAFSNPDSNPLYYAKKLYLNKQELTELVIPEGIRELKDYAFSHCSSLTSVTIPDGVTSIGERAFNHCSSLASVAIPDSVTSIGRAAFSACFSLVSVTMGAGVASIGLAAFDYCSSLTSVHITDLSAWCKIRFSNYSSNPLTFAKKLYLNNQELIELVIPEGITEIKDCTFFGCSSFTSIYIPDCVTSIGSAAFSECSSLTSIYIPNGVTSIGNAAFTDCSSLTSVTIGTGVTSIGEWAFSGCSSLTSIDIPDGVNSISEGAFSDCSSLTSIDIPDGVTSIGKSAFSGCSFLTSIDIPDSITSIGYAAFKDCSSLTFIDIPDGVTLIDGWAFSGCSSLTSIDIPDGVISIEYHAFYKCSSLTSINIPNSVTLIGYAAFRYCSSLTSIAIPAGVTSIGSYAFYDCSLLKDFYCYAITPPNINVSIYNYASFPSYGEKTSLYVPKGCSSAYQKSAWATYFKTIKEMD